jgi:DNA-binding winged helix-turn-helix (wHTH) protein
MPLSLIDQKVKRRPNGYTEPWTVTREPSSLADDCALEFGRFQVLLRRRELLADGVPVKLGTRAFEILLALLEGDGSLVTKDELERRVWPGVFVAEENLKTQICTLRRALGEDGGLIRTDFGRGYRFVGTIHSDAAGRTPRRPTRQRQHDRLDRRMLTQGASRRPQRATRGIANG